MQCLHVEQRMGQFEGFSLSWPVLVLEDGSFRLNSTMWSGAAHMGKCSSSHSLQQNCRGPSLLLAVEQTMGKIKTCPTWYPTGRQNSHLPAAQLREGLCYLNHLAQAPVSSPVMGYHHLP